ncbi:DUF72 domain-containing protein [Aquimarina sp. ERC-38]|uniref:DUF72 domain-containing protein n=1 Tax=Aquimarina sp. ERC-38 TaxID=2949996 RepID=UPI002245239C|nr:DUF72 domain-containing protein [Aquimarina sp. ERC-38]UZO79549.1 DUF72 domain-containing protein [Aquimarina sp. ERC-38]
MEWGKLDDPRDVDFTLPSDPIDYSNKWGGSEADDFLIYVGYANLSKVELKGFYPKGTKELLPYYSSQLNAIEFNATFYKDFPKEQLEKWRCQTMGDFKFFPKVPRTISHDKKLHPDASPLVRSYVHSIQHFGSKLGIPFLQMSKTFTPHNGFYLKQFIENWPTDVPLAIELRHKDWYRNPGVSNRLYDLLEAHKVTHIITDTPGKRELLHMRLTSKTAFIRFVASELSADYQRMDDWIERIFTWKKLGLAQVCFFIHQDVQKTKPFLAHYLIPKINEVFKTSLKLPTHDYHQPNLFT